MKIITPSLLLATLSFSLLLVSSDKADPFERLLANLEKQTYDYVQEKVYLHLDKPYYSKGDDLWFKAYTVAGPNHTPSPLSENLYVELIGPEARVIKRHTIFMSKGMGKGDFQLTDSLTAGRYRLRAYTNWMRNFDEDFYFQRQFELLDPLVDAEIKKENTTSVQSIRFFPEGGDLVENVPSVVAFELNQMEGPVNGKIYDQEDNVVLAFTSAHEGRGKFNLLPVTGKWYYARLDGKAQKHPLPEAKANGIVLSADNLKDSGFVLVNVKTAQVEVTNEAFLVVHSRGLVAFASKLQWKGATARAKIPRKDLPEGIAHITLFNKQWRPEAERLIFLPQNKELFSLSMAADKAVYEKRDSTTIRLKLTDVEGKPVKGFFSMNVYDTQQIKPDDYKEDIRTSLLLTSDLKGEIDNPLQYFSHSNPNAVSDLDLLLITKGWVRFRWKDLLEDKFPELPHSVEQGFTVTGRITQKNNDKPIPKGSVKQVGVFEGVPLFAEASTNNKGEFTMNRLHYYAGGSVLNAKDKKGRSNIALHLDAQPESGLTNEITFSEEKIYEGTQPTEDYVTKSRERRDIVRAFNPDSVTDLGSVVVEANAIDREFADLARGLVFNRGEYSVNVTDAMARGQRYQNALYALQGKVPGLNIVLGANGEPNVILNRKVFSFINQDPPVSYYLDDSPVDLAVITSLPAEKVERVEVLKGMRATSLFGPSANGGAILFYTKTQEDFERYYKQLAENNVVLDKSTKALKGGYYQSRAFYTPDYRGEGRKAIKPDYRDLIHWEPMIETDQNGEAVIKFFNADLPTTIRVNLEGIWEGGIPLVTYTEYKVK